MTKHELLIKILAAKASMQEKQDIIDRIKTAIANLGTLPTLGKLREFLATLKELLHVNN